MSATARSVFPFAGSQSDQDAVAQAATPDIHHAQRPHSVHATGQTDWPSFVQDEAGKEGAAEAARQDHFIRAETGAEFAGTHIIIDFWGAVGLEDLDLMERAMREAVDQSGATLLHIHLHHFTPNDGISGVAVLAESHISVHTWPERSFAAFDIFMCGDAQPQRAAEVLARAFRPERTVVHTHRRGEVAGDG